MGQKAEAEVGFIVNMKGEVCIAFSDPAFVQTDTVLVDPRAAHIHAILHQEDYDLGPVSPAILEQFGRRREALLAAVRPDGSIFELSVPIRVAQGGKA